MAEQTFRSPNFFEREIDLSAPTVQGPTGVPAGVIGTANKGPAFVPITVRDFSQFVQNFGNLDPKKHGPYAVKQFLENKTSLTYLRVLGAGSNTEPADVAKTKSFGRVKNAGFNVNADGNDKGGVYFLMSQISGTLAGIGSPDFEYNDTFSGNVLADGNIINAAIFMPTGSALMMFHVSQSMSSVNFSSKNDGSDGLDITGGDFKLVISSSRGSSYSMDDGLPGLKIFTASLNPASTNYVGKILNTDSTKFAVSEHYLHAHFPVDVEVALPMSASILSGTTGVGFDNVTYRNLFGTYDSRYTAPKTTHFISQPFGNVEHELFYVESLDDGEYANNLYKISITNLKRSVDETNPYGSFTLQVRSFYDNDSNPNVLEQYNDCNLNPESPNYIANMIGDRKISYSFDVDNPNERRTYTTGNFANNSKYIRVIVTQNVKDKKIPQSCLPFGFRGPSLLKTSNSLTATGDSAGGRLGNSYYTGVSAVLPPIPFRTKITRGGMEIGNYVGSPGKTEFVAPGLYWGVKFERNNVPMDPNNTTEPNQLIENMTKFVGIEKMDALLTGSWADDVNNNKFSLAKVALLNGSLNDITGSASQHMLGAVYQRDGKFDINEYKINLDSFGSRVTLAALANATDLNYDQTSPINAAANFNRFSQFMKFTTFMYGGFDGVNILDKDAQELNDRSVSFQTGGGASSTYVSPGLSSNQAGSQKDNNGVNSYKTAVDIMTDPFQTIANILIVPGIRESYITDYTGTRCKDYSLSIYLMDIPSYDDNGNIIFDGSNAKPSIEKTSAAFENRAIDNNYVATYFPDVYVDDATNRRRVKIPSSIAALSALGFNDRVSYPWFAPAGFNRAALDFVTNVGVRLNVSDRDRLYDARINPIATFPRQGYVIYGQKTLQISKSALDRVNVRRLLLEVKRTIVSIANKLVFEQNTPAVRNKFVADAALQLGFIQAQAGIEAFQVVMNESNNTQDDIDNNRLRGRIVVVPTRVIEFIAIDFIVTNSGVQFE